MTEQQIAETYLKVLADRFKNKIDPEKYYLSYSGGKDSHFLYWFIKEYLHDESIVIVGVNTSFEIPDIRDRILKNSDVVLHPIMNRWEIKERYGIPCFSKKHDEYIKRYQNGSRTENTMKYINGENPIHNLSKKPRELLLAGKLHKISPMCCVCNKEKPMDTWGRKNGRKAIMGVRGDESINRKAQYKSCLTAKGSFTPLWDFTDELMDIMYRVYEIEIPSCYQYLTRTGCGGCPYGRNTETELSILPRLQRMNAIKYFKESYDVKGVNYDNLQMVLNL